MARVTSQEVKEIITTSKEDLRAFITPANLIVTEKLSSEHSDALLKEIERWLSAHFIACSERQPTKIRIGESETSWNWNQTQGLESTTYGQAVLALDTSGVMSNEIGGKKVVLNTLMDLPTDS